MKAVNLIPADERKGGGAGSAGRSSGVVYVLLGALSLLVILSGVYVVAGKSINDKEHQLAVVQRDTKLAQAQADRYAAYSRFADLRAKRVQTVTQLADSRFDWAHALREVARVMPENAWLTDLIGTTSPNVQVQGGGGASSLRSALPVPAVQVSGCTTSQSSVAKMMARMRLIDGVQRVSLSTSEKNDSDSGANGAGNSNTGGDCRNGHSHFPRFELVVFFDAPAAPATAGAAPGAAGTPAAQTTPAPAAGSTAPAAATSTTPSSTPTPASGGKTP